MDGWSEWAEFCRRAALALLSVLSRNGFKDEAEEEKAVTQAVRMSDGLLQELNRPEQRRTELKILKAYRYTDITSQLRPKCAEHITRLLREKGINLSYATALDVFGLKYSDVVNGRGFGTQATNKVMRYFADKGFDFLSKGKK